MVRPDEVLERPKRFSTPELAKMNVTIVSRGARVALQCDMCGAMWSFNLPLPRGYWRCPNACNRDYT
jgi:hypothetical protein